MAWKTYFVSIDKDPRNQIATVVVRFAHTDGVRTSPDRTYQLVPGQFQTLSEFKAWVRTDRERMDSHDTVVAALATLSEGDEIKG